MDRVSEFNSHIDAADALAAYFRVDQGRTITRVDALRCLVKFVRSQAQLAALSKGATGRRMTAAEVFDTYGPDTMREVMVEGSVSLIEATQEPAVTLRERREALNLTADDVAAYLRTTVETVEKAELRAASRPSATWNASRRCLASTNIGWVSVAREAIQACRRRSTRWPTRCMARAPIRQPRWRSPRPPGSWHDS